jgi:hypothetical protein
VKQKLMPAPDAELKRLVAVASTPYDLAERSRDGSVSTSIVQIGLKIQVNFRRRPIGKECLGTDQRVHESSELPARSVGLHCL